jgi:hypothetical protein
MTWPLQLVSLLSGTTTHETEVVGAGGWGRDVWRARDGIGG